MSEYETDTGAIVRHYTRAVVSRDTPNDGGADILSSVGPLESGGGNVLFDAGQPITPQPWAGWPVDWNPPHWGPPGWWQNRTSTVGTCCDTIGRACCQFPPRVLRGDLLLDPQPNWTTNPEPRMYANFDEWLKTVINSLLLRGEFFVAATGRDYTGYPVRWITLNPDTVAVDFEDGEIVYRLGDEILNPADILHVKHQTLPGALRGFSPLTWLAQNLISADALAAFGADLASRGGIPWGVLTHPGNLRAGQAAELRDGWNTAAANRNGAPAILSGGMTLQTLSMTPEQMALLSLREFDEQRIGAAFGVPSTFLNLPQPTGMTYHNAQMVQSHFYWDTLRPIVKNIGDGLSNWALPRGTNTVFDAADYLTPDLPTLIGALVQASTVLGPDGTPAVGADDIRRAIGLPLLGQLGPQPVTVEGDPTLPPATPPPPQPVGVSGP